MSEVERRYAELERSLEPQRQRSIARGPVGLIGVLVALSLAVGTVAAVDLRRLQTPRGTALAWTGAAVFGDCTAYERLSFGGLSESGCRDLREQTAEAREQSGQFGILLLRVEREGRVASALMRLTGPETTRDVQLELRRKGDGWAVERTSSACAAVFCP